ncbi:MAG: hypothetical protein NVS3B20_10010 [Polyangiales bacterium]
MLRSLSTIALLALAATGCHRHRNEAPPPAYASAPPPATYAPPPPAPPPCGPLGVWAVSGPTGTSQFEVAKGDTPDTFVFRNRGTAAVGGMGAMSSGTLTVNPGAATGGIYSCNMAADCNSMSCGLAGGTPMVFTKSATSM